MHWAAAETTDAGGDGKAETPDAGGDRAAETTVQEEIKQQKRAQKRRFEQTNDLLKLNEEINTIFATEKLCSGKKIAKKPSSVRN